MGRMIVEPYLIAKKEDVRFILPFKLRTLLIQHVPI